MKYIELLNEFKDLMSQLVSQVEASAAMGHFDIHKVSEGLVLGILRELYGWSKLRSLNVEEKANFPAIDLADDESGVAVQVTGTPTLEKVRKTIKTFLSHDLDKRYRRLIFYVLTRKQANYSQEAIDRIANGRIAVTASADILDMRDICARAANIEPQRLSAALEVVRAYMQGNIVTGLADTDFDPPALTTERVNLNLIEVYFPQQLYIAHLLDDVGSTKGRSVRNERRLIRETLIQLNLHVPSGYEVSGRQLITFHPLGDSQGPFAKLIDLGTVTPLRPMEFYRVDEDQERIFKSLLRRTLQHKLFQHRVQWMHEDRLFAFLPYQDADYLREETWLGHKKNTRRVYERKLNKNDPNKTFICKHFAFSVDFLQNDGRWYASLIPDWYFSYGDDYRRSRYSDESLKWLKRREVNRTVSDHFRFLSSWLVALDQEDLFSSATGHTTVLTFGDMVYFDNHPALPDESWLPAHALLNDDDDSPITGLFDLP